MNLFLLSSPDVNWWTGVVWITCGLLWCFYQLFGLSFWRHPLLRQWWNDTFLQIWWRFDTFLQSRMAWGWGYIQQNFHFWVNSSFQEIVFFKCVFKSKFNNARYCWMWICLVCKRYRCKISRRWCQIHICSRNMLAGLAGHVERTFCWCCTWLVQLGDGVCVCVCVCVVVFAKSAVRLIDGHLRGLPEEQTEHATIKHGPQSQSS